MRGKYCMHMFEWEGASFWSHWMCLQPVLHVFNILRGIFEWVVSEEKIPGVI